MVLAGALSGIFGLLSAAFPAIIQDFIEERKERRKRNYLELEQALQKERAAAEQDVRERERTMALLAAEMRTTRETMVAAIEAGKVQTGVHWLDLFNGLIRPATAAMMVILLAMTTIVFTYGLAHSLAIGKIDAVQFGTLLWSSAGGDAMGAVIGYLFGYRGGVKLPSWLGKA